MMIPLIMKKDILIFIKLSSIIDYLIRRLHFNNDSIE